MDPISLSAAICCPQNGGDLSSDWLEAWYSGGKRRHLYEEAMVILSGEGVIWTENRHAPVAPDDVIYLPARQGHSLESTAHEGMRLMGVFYHAGSPAINY